MKYKVLISAPYFQDVIERFREYLIQHDIEIIIPAVRERLEEEELLTYITDIDGVMCGDDRFTERVLRAAPKLKVISKWGTGIDSIDAEACKKYGMKLCNTPNAFTEPVADSVLAYMLCFARKTPWMDTAMKKGVWKKIQGFALREKTLGVIGVGNIGKAVVKRARAFGMRVLGNDIRAIDEAFVQETGVEMVALASIYKDADFISLNCDLNQTSKYILNRDSFKLLEKKPFIINTARGPLIHEESLIQALQEGCIAGAGLDVFEHEPLPLNSPLLAMDEVLIAPHNANSSAEAWERVHQNTINNLIKGLHDGR